MNNLNDSVFAKDRERSKVAGIEQERENAPLAVSVVFTEPKGTLAALKAARTLARDLGTSIEVLVPQSVPYAYSLSQPPVSLEFTKQALSRLVSQDTDDKLDTRIHLILCRDRLQTLLRVLHANSLIVIGGRKRWWPTAESRLAKALRTQGHEVVFTCT